MSLQSRNTNHIDFSPDGQTLYFTKPDTNSLDHGVSMFDVASGEYKGENCNATYWNETTFNPSAFRVSPYGENLHFVTDGGTGKVSSYSSSGCNVTNKKTVFNEAGWNAFDIAFGSEDILYVLAYNAPKYRVYKVNLTTTVAAEIGNLYTGVVVPVVCSDTEITAVLDSSGILEARGFTGIEAFPDDTFYVTNRGTSFGYSGCTTTSATTFYTPAVFGYYPNGEPMRMADGSYTLFGARSNARNIDGYGIRKGLNGHLYVSDYSFGLPWVIDRYDGWTLGRLGSSFGMLIFAHQMAFNPGPFGPRCDVSVSKMNVKASEALTVTVDVLNGNGDPFCGEPHLTAVQSGYTWFGEAPSYNSKISSFTDFKRDDTLCHRWHVNIVGEVASLVYEDNEGNQVTDYRLKEYCNGNVQCSLGDYKFSVSVYTGDLAFGNVLGDQRIYSVAPYLPFANETQLESSISRQTANATACVKIVSKDEFGNELLYGGAGDQFSFVVDGVKYEKETVETDTQGLPIVFLDLEDNGDGTYNLCTQFGPAGVHVVDIHLETNGRYLPVKSSPLSVFVAPGSPLGRISSGIGAGLESIKARAGDENVFYVQARDSRGNNVPKLDLDNGDLQVHIRVYSSDGNDGIADDDGDGDRTPNDRDEDDDEGGEELKVEVEWEIESDGRFRVSYVVSGELKRDEDYLLASLDVKIRGENVALETVDGIQLQELKGYVVKQGERIVKYRMTEGMRAAMLFECVFLITACLLFLGLVKYWEKENAIKFSQRRFLYIILGGILTLYISFLLLVIKEMNDTICAVENFLFHLSIWVVLLAIGCKTYRTNKIANNKYMKRVKITDVMLLKFMGAVLFVVIVLLTVQAAKYPAKNVERMGTPKLTDDNVKLTYIVETCTAGISPVSALLWFGELSGIIYLAVLAHFTRKVPSAFAEAKYIALSIYNIILVLVFMAIMVVAVKIDTDFPELFVGVTGFAMFMGGGVMQGLIFIPKFVLVLKKREVKMEDIMMTTKVGSRRSSKNDLGGSEHSPMTDAGRNMSGSGVYRAGSVKLMGGGSFTKRNDGMGMMNSVKSGAIGSMATHLESEERERGDSGILGGEANETIDGLRKSLDRMKKLESQLRKDNARQQNEIEKMKTLNATLSSSGSTATGRGGVRRTSSMSVIPPGNSEWSAFQDDEGHTYYYNSKTFECSYEVPRKW